MNSLENQGNVSLHHDAHDSTHDFEMSDLLVDYDPSFLSHDENFNYLHGNFNTISDSSQYQSGCSTDAFDVSLVYNTVPEINHNQAVDTEWSMDEQLILEQGIKEFSAKSKTMKKYIKIAATLANKTVRDVALRYKWMMIKRRKHEEEHLGRKGKAPKKKGKTSKTSLKTNMTSSNPPIEPSTSSFMTHHTDQNRWFHNEGDASVSHLSAQSFQLYNQLGTNFYSSMPTHIREMSLQPFVNINNGLDNSTVHFNLRESEGPARF